MRILLLADIHIGSVRDTDYVLRVIEDILDRELVFIKTDAVVILGDLFHRSLRVNEDYTKLALKVIGGLIERCSKNKCKIRMIYGTEGHEAGQYHLITQYPGTIDVDLKVITKVCSEELFPGTRVLYLPEEYITDPNTYYEEAFSEHYDYIFGHGIIQEGMPMIGPESAGSGEKRPARFKSGQLAAAGDLVVFGHYHCFTDLGNNVYYLGSLFRDSFGEETPKGYGVVEDGKFRFIENIEAYVYRTYEYPEDSEIFSGIDALKAEIERIRSENSQIFSGEKHGRIRMIFHIPRNVDNAFIETMRTMLFNEKNIVTLIRQVTEEERELENTISVEYDFILDKSLSVVDKIHRYIGKNFPDMSITLEELSGFINDELKI